jgi:hypothetical protein
MASVITYEVHPAIGIARVGSSQQVFPAPEPDCTQPQYDGPGPVPKPSRTQPPPAYRDNQNLLMRQATRFRVFKVTRDAQTQAITACEEVRAGSGAAIGWSVHLANRKAAADCFVQPKKGRRAKRNPNPGVPRDKLVIDAGEQSPLGNDVNSARTLQGKFKGNIPVTLGQVWTDGEGRLMVAGGYGKSASPDNTALDDDNFADNDGWYDDVSDGPVRITSLKINGVPVPANRLRHAWLIVAPFDFAPEIDSFITLYDVARQATIGRWAQLPARDPAATNFWRDIVPVLERTRRYRWVNAWALIAEGQGRHTQWRSAAGITDLGDKTSASGTTWREALFAHLPDPNDPLDHNKRKRDAHMPRLHDHDDKAGSVLLMTPLQYRHFENWAGGLFNATQAPETEFLCESMDRIALQACSGGPFYPGIEAPRIMQDGNTYEAPLRIDRTLAPGSITAGLAIPWQADFYACQMEKDMMWWPASRPDHVFLAEPTVPVDEQMEYDVRPWAIGVQNVNAMVASWHQLGIVKKRLAKIQVNDNKQPEVEDLLSQNPRYYFFYEQERDPKF